MSIILIVIFVLLVVYFFKKKYKPNKQIIPIEEQYKPQSENWNQLPMDSLFQSINTERAKRNLSILIPEKLLISLAEEKVNEMIAKKEVNHSGAELRAEKSQSVAVEENVCGGYSTEKAMFYAYMNSDGHRANICKQGSTHIGVFTKEEYNCCIFAKY